jgi:hypothetical protein
MFDVDIHHEIRNNSVQLEEVVELLEGNENTDLAMVKDCHGNLPLHEVMLVDEEGTGLIELFRLLVKMNPEGVRTKNKYGSLPIHYPGPATPDGDKSREFLLTQYPEALKVQNNWGRLPVHYAACRGFNALKEEKKRVATLIEEMKKDDDQRFEQNNKLHEVSTQRYEEALGQEKQQVAILKDQVEKIVQNSKNELNEAKKRGTALIIDNKEYVKQLEQEKNQNASLKEQVDRAEKRMQSFEVARKSESKLLSKLLHTGDDWTVQDLKSIAQSLNTRLDALKTEFQAGSQPSMAQRLIHYLLKETSPPKEDLLRTIETINSELSEVENTVAGLSTSEASVIPEATSSFDESPANVPRKRVRVSISPT